VACLISSMIPFVIKCGAGKGGSAGLPSSTPSDHLTDIPEGGDEPPEEGDSGHFSDIDLDRKDSSDGKEPQMFTIEEDEDAELVADRPPGIIIPQPSALPTGRVSAA